MGRGAELLSKIIRGGKATDSASEVTVNKMAASYGEGMRAHIVQEIPNIHVHAVQCDSKVVQVSGTSVEVASHESNHVSDTSTAVLTFW